ncbi:MAG: helix-turn-helix domain-containing protein [Bacilli bacterium]
MKIIANNNKPNEIIKIIRECSEQTQEQFAKEIGKSKDTVQSYELGRNKMSLNSFMELAKKEKLIITIEKK